MSHPLWLAIKSLNISLVKKVVEDLVLKGETVASMGRYKGGMTPVFWACSLCNPSESQEVEDTIYSIVKLLVENKGDFHKKSDTEETCLMAAFFNKRFEVCKFLIDQGANVDDVDSDENTILHNLLQYCSKRDDDEYEIIKLLVSKVDINKPNTIGKTYLMLAADLGDFDLCKLIVDRGADVNATCMKGYTALHCATRPCVWFDHPPVTKETICKICELILENNADPITKNGETCLMRAIENNDYKLCELLISKSVDLDVKSPTTGNTALHCALDDEILDISIIELLLKAGADVTICNKTEDDFLQHACLLPCIEVVQLVYNLGVYSDERLVEAYKLIGSSLVILAAKDYLNGSNEYKLDITQGVCFWRQALELQEKYTPLLNDKSDSWPKLAFKNVHQFQTTEDIDGMENNLEFLFIQALLVHLSIMGPLHEKLEQAAVVMATNDCDQIVCLPNHRHNAFSRTSTLEFKKFVLVLKLVKYGLYINNEAAYYFRELKDYFMKMLNEHHGNHKHLNFACTDLMDVMEFIIILIEKSFQNDVSKSQAEGRHDGLRDVFLQFPYFLFLFFATPSSLGHLEVLKKLTLRINRIITYSGLPHLLLHEACSERINWETHDLQNLTNLGKIFPSPQVVQLLLECGGNPCADDDNAHSSLHVLASNGEVDSEVVDILISNGAHLDQCNIYGEMAYELLALKLYKVDKGKLITLKCLAARTVSKHHKKVGEIPAHLVEFVNIHRFCCRNSPSRLVFL